MSEHDDTGIEMFADGDSRYVVFMSDKPEDEEFIVANPADLRDLGEMQ